MSVRSSDVAAELTADGLLARVREVTPLIARRARDAEQARKPDDDVIDALKGTGVFRAFVPRRFGGYEIDLGLFVDVGIAVSEACPSTGWITTFYMEHNWLLSQFPAEVQAEVFAERGFILAPGGVNPGGAEARAVDGGVELTGRWRFATGIVHADWVLLSVVAPSGDQPLQRLCLIPFDQVEVVDSWHVDGMAATGSRDVVANAVFVPERRISPEVPPQPVDGPPYLTRIPVRPFLSLTASIPALGAARRAVQLYRDLVSKRVRLGTRKVQADSASAQIRLAQVLARVRATETVLRSCASAIEGHARGGARLSGLEQTEMMLTLANVVRDSRDVVRQVQDGAGASAHFLDQELQRIGRDVQMMSAHVVFDVDLAAERAGRARLESDAPLFQDA